MKNILITLLLYLVVHVGVNGQSSRKKDLSLRLSIPDYMWDYNKLPPDTAEFILQKGRLADSIKNFIFSSNEDSNRVWKYYLLAQKNLFINSDSTLFYAQIGAQLAQKINFEPGDYYCTRMIGWAYIYKGIYSKSLSIHFDLLKRAQRMNNDYRQAWELQSIAYAYIFIGDALTSLRYDRQALEKIMPYTKMYPGSMEDILIKATGDYIALNQLDTALLLVKKASEIDGQIHRYWATPIRLMADIYVKKGQYQTALHLYKKSFHYAKYLFPVPIDTLYALNGIAAVFAIRGQYDSSLYYAKSVLASEAGFIDARLKTYTIIADSYKAKNKIDSAFKYQQLLIKLKDDILGQERIRQIQNFAFSQQLQQQEIAAAKAQYRNKIRTYVLLAALGVFLLAAFLLWRNNQHKQRAYALLHQQKEKTDLALEELKATQAQLIQREKMASLGELTAGIAHEIQNPLNFVNNFSETNTELMDELQAALQAGNYEEAFAISADLKDNEQKINLHGKRADAIVKGMLEHSRTSSGQKQLTVLNNLAAEYLRLAYHGIRAKDKDFNATIQTSFDETIGKINVIPQDLGRVLLNLFNNAFYAVGEKKKRINATYEPTVMVSTEKLDNRIKIRVKDNGMGISKSIVDKIFQPFFTTKPTGEGTGLGLSLSYDIIKAHGGELNVESIDGEGATFIISLPIEQTR